MSPIVSFLQNSPEGEVLLELTEAHINSESKELAEVLQQRFTRIFIFIFLEVYSWKLKIFPRGIGKSGRHQKVLQRHYRKSESCWKAEELKILVSIT